MPKRGGLGQRGLDLLISASPGGKESAENTVKEGKSTDKKAGTSKSTSKSNTKSSTKSSGKSSAKSTSKKSQKSAAKTGTRNTDKTGAKSASKGTSKTGTKTDSMAVVTAAAENPNADGAAAVQGAEVSGRTRPAKTSAAYTHVNKANATNDSANTKAKSNQKVTVDKTAAVTINEPLQVSIDLVEPNRSQPRKNFDEDSLQELADSIKQFGVIQPLIVQKKDDYYEIIAGERRWRASRIAGLKKLPVIVKDYTDREVMEISLIENIQREDLNPIEEAAAYKKLMDEYNLRQDEVAQRVSRSRAAVANSVRLLNLDQRVQDMVVSEMLTTGHARTLLAITDPELQYNTAQRVFDEKMSVREVERLVRKLLETPKPPKQPAVSETLMTVYAGMEEAMKTALGTKVTIAPKSAQKGKIEIEYYTADDLDRICELLKMPTAGIRG